MAITYGFFDARQSSSGVYDRVYTAEQMSKYFKGIFTDGILMNVGQMLAVSAASGMVVQVGTGRAFLDARWMENDTILDLTVPAAHAILNRIDLVVARLDYDARLIEIAVKGGTAASVPVAPSVERTAFYYELALAEISIPAGTEAITQSMITDTRADEAVCGYVTGLIEQIDTETFWTQLQDAFGAWFDEMKGQLSEDAAGHLQLEIDAILGDFATHELTATASQAYAVGDYLVYDGILYRVIAAIDEGDALDAGANIEQTTVAVEFERHRILPITFTAFSSLPQTVTDSRITAEHVVVNSVLGTPSAQTGDWTVTTADGSVSVSGSISGSTTLTLYLALQQ